MDDFEVEGGKLLWKINEAPQKHIQ